MFSKFCVSTAAPGRSARIRLLLFYLVNSLRTLCPATESRNHNLSCRSVENSLAYVSVFDACCRPCSSTTVRSVIAHFPPPAPRLRSAPKYLDQIQSPVGPSYQTAGAAHCTSLSDLLRGSIGGFLFSPPGSPGQHVSCQCLPILPDQYFQPAGAVTF